MWRLKNLADLLRSEDCRYTINASYPTIDNGATIAAELLELGRDKPREYVALVVPQSQRHLLVIYAGDDPASMRETLGALKLPNSLPTNLGEKLFYIFRGHLGSINNSGVYLEQKVKIGKEEQFFMVLKKLADYYKAASSNTGSLGASLRNLS
ncbi:hypothetical protein HYU06_04340 [Candidatus Woesearchaeota archaeon]|nr:hypothetical protein [Candidatus Woesearchaeota archaeon]